MTRTALKHIIFVFLLGAGSLGAGGCAGRRVPEPDVSPGTPSVGWVIMHGSKDNPDEQFGCQSRPRTDCVVEASTPGGQALSHVHLYFQPTQTETTYAGVVRVGFFSDGATSGGIKPEVTVKPGEVRNHSVIGLVTDKPGRYVFTVDMTATMQGGGTRQIRDEVAVVVSPKAAGAVASTAAHR